MAKHRKERERDRERDHDDVDTTPVSIGETPTEDSKPEPRVSLAFAVNADKSRVDWSRMKSDKGRERLRALIAEEAKSMGFVEKSATQTTEGAITGAMVFGLLNSVIAGAAQPLKLTPEELRIAMLSDQEQAALNEGGRVDRLARKYFGDTTFKYADEVFFALIAISLVNAKTQAIRELRRARKPTMVHQMPHPTTTSEETPA